MNLRFFRRIGWISVILAFCVAGASDQGTLTAAQTLLGGALGACGLLLAAFGQSMVILHARHGQRRLQRVPVRADMPPVRRRPHGW